VGRPPLEAGERPEGGEVDRAGAEAAADDRHAVRRAWDAEAPPGDGRIGLEDLPRHRPTGDDVGSVLTPGNREGEADAAGAAGEQAVGPPEVAVGPRQDQGQAPPHPPPPPPAPHRTAPPPHHLGPARLPDPARRTPRPARAGGARPGGGPAAPRRNQALDGVGAVGPPPPEEADLVAGGGDEPRLGGLGGAEEAALGALSARRVGAGDRRHDVPRRAAGRY